jgi:hypothetical protein
LGRARGGSNNTMSYGGPAGFANETSRPPPPISSLLVTAVSATPLTLLLGDSFQKHFHTGTGRRGQTAAAIVLPEISRLLNSAATTAAALLFRALACHRDYIAPSRGIRFWLRHSIRRNLVVSFLTHSSIFRIRRKRSRPSCLVFISSQQHARHSPVAVPRNPGRLVWENAAGNGILRSQQREALQKN